MAWGYNKSFTIEYDPTLKRKIDCKSCIYYLKDKSCSKRPLYLPVDGYNSWRNCPYFELDAKTSNYEHKKSQYEKLTSLKVKSETHPKTSSHVDTIKVIKKTDETNFTLNNKKEEKKIGKYIYLIPTKDIAVAKELKNKDNHAERIKLAEASYQKKKCFTKPILAMKVNGKTVIKEGYAKYCVAQIHNIKLIPVIYDVEIAKRRKSICKVSGKVLHKKYGMGTVIAFDLVSIFVKFEQHSEMEFIIDDCVNKNFLVSVIVD